MFSFSKKTIQRKSFQTAQTIQIILEPAEISPAALTNLISKTPSSFNAADNPLLKKRFSCVEKDDRSQLAPQYLSQLNKRRSICVTKNSDFNAFSLQAARNRFITRFSLPNINKTQHSSIMKSKINKPSEDNSRDKIMASGKKNSKFSSSLSKTGQCAILKTYEDEIYSQLKMRNPRRNLPRVSTAEFNSKSKSKCSKDLSELGSSSPTLLLTCVDSCCDVADENFTETNVTFEEMIEKQIDKAKKILDDIARVNKTEQSERDAGQNFFLSENGSNSFWSDRLGSVVRDYEEWHRKWSRMLNKMF